MEAIFLGLLMLILSIVNIGLSIYHLSQRGESGWAAFHGILTVLFFLAAACWFYDGIAGIIG